MRHRAAHRRDVARRRHQPREGIVRLHRQRRQLRQLQPDLAGRCGDRGPPARDRLVALVDAQAVEDDALRARLLRGCGDGDRDRVAEQRRAQELELLRGVDGARTWQLRAEHGRDERAAEHPVRDDAFEPLGGGVCAIEMRRVGIARDGGEARQVVLGDRPLQRCGRPDLDLVEGAVLDLSGSAHRLLTSSGTARRRPACRSGS